MNGTEKGASAAIDVEALVATDQYFSFHLSGKIFAIPVMRITEIVEYAGVTNVPTLPSFIHGALNLRGNILPVINLAKKLRLESQPIDSRTCIVLIEVDMEGDMTQMGIVVDGVHQVVDLNMANVTEAPSMGLDIKSEFVEGVIRLEEKVFTLLDVDRVLSPQEIAFSYMDKAG